MRYVQICLFLLLHSCKPLQAQEVGKNLVDIKQEFTIVDVNLRVIEGPIHHTLFSFWSSKLNLANYLPQKILVVGVDPSRGKVERQYKVVAENYYKDPKRARQVVPPIILPLKYPRLAFEILVGSSNGGEVSIAKRKVDNTNRDLRSQVERC